MEPFSKPSSILRRLFGIVTLAVLFLLLEFSVVYYFTNHFLRGFVEAYRTEQYLQEIFGVQDSIKENAKTVSATLLSGADTRSLEAIYDLRFQKNLRSLTSLRQALSANTDLAQEFDVASQSYHRTGEAVKKLFELLSEGTPTDETLKKAKTRVLVAEEFRTETSESLSRILISLRSQLDLAFENLYASRNRPVYFTLLFTFLAGLFFLTAAFQLTGRIRRSLKNLDEFTRQVGRGDLAVEAKILYPDEIGQLTDSFNRMTKNLNEVTVSKTMLEEKNQEIQKRTEELASSNQELEQFAYVASHDLQEPLRMVASFTQLLSNKYSGKMEKDADEYIAFAVDGAKRMQALINDLLQYSRVGSQAKKSGPVDLDAVVRQALENLKITIEKNGARVTRDPLPITRGDEGQLVRLFQNLIANAIKFQKKGEAPKIHVGLQEKGKGEVCVFVRDNGIGIESQYFEKIFQIFQRLHGREEYAGTGIGLAICKKIVERHGGKIWVESEPGKGSTFSLTLPGPL